MINQNIITSNNISDTQNTKSAPKDFTILMVDDDSELLESFSEIFQLAGYQVETADGGLNAFEKFKLKSYDLIITDMRMPEGDGAFLVKNIRGQNKEVPVFCVTGYSHLTNAEMSAIGINMIFEKPCEIKQLLNSVSSTLKIS